MKRTEIFTHLLFLPAFIQHRLERPLYFLETFPLVFHFIKIHNHFYRRVIQIHDFIILAVMPGYDLSLHQTINIRRLLVCVVQVHPTRFTRRDRRWPPLAVHLSALVALGQYLPGIQDDPG